MRKAAYIMLSYFLSDGSYNNTMKKLQTASPVHHNVTHGTLKTTVYATASLITALSVAERALGFLYRVVLSRLIGAEGLGLYQVSLSLFAVFLTIGTGGIPITVSRFISKSKAENTPQGVGQAVSAGLLLSLLLTLPAFLFFEIFADKCTFLFSDSRAVPVFRILLLGLIFSSLFAVLRGSFWGHKDFFVPAVLEMAEEAVMVIAGVLILRSVDSPLAGATGAAWAVVVSYVFSFTASALCFFVRGGKLSKPQTALKPLFSSALPITTVRTSGTLLNSAVAVLLPAMLVRAGYSSSEALTLFGVVSGMAFPVLMIPSTVIGSLSVVLVPELSEDYYGKNDERLQKNIRRGVKVAFLVACFLLPFFYALGEDAGKIAFSNALAGEMIKRGCIVLLPMCLSMISTGILNSMGFEKQSFIFYFVGAAALLLCILFLPPLCGAYAYIIGLGASYVISAACNLTLLAKKCPKLFSLKDNGYFRTEAFALLSILPLSLAGSLFSSLFKKLLGETLAFCATATAVLLTLAVLWLCLGVLSPRALAEAFTSKKRRKKRAV